MPITQLVSVEHTKIFPRYIMGGIIKNIISFLAIIVLLCGCASFAYQNKALKEPDSPPETKASFKIKTERKNHKNTLGILALSGGGSRSAYWSASAMLALEEVFSDLNILEEIDAISSVSGGSLPAAYYAISYSPDKTDNIPEFGRKWDKETVQDLMGRNYKLRWVGNWFWPNNILKYWFTAYDRSDIMAQTLADNLYDKKIGGFDLKFKDINPERPNIILNATNGTEEMFSEIFTFTDDTFLKLNSDISRYKISNAVMATASFPAVFNYMTLRDHNYQPDGNRKYVHIFDGGNADNLGLESVKKFVDTNAENYERIFIILVDAFTETKGVSDEDYDARKFLDYAVDLNFLDSVDSLLATNRKIKIKDFQDSLKKHDDKYIIFYHIEFDDIKDTALKETLHKIKTDFAIQEQDRIAIDKAINMLIVQNNNCIQKIKNMILEEIPGISDYDCKCIMGDGPKCLD
jgi:NTE family protein